MKTKTADKAAIKTELRAGVELRSSALLAELSAQEKLMKAAQRFAIAFDQDRRWNDETARLAYTLQSWKELAMAAMEFSAGNSANDRSLLPLAAEKGNE